MAYYLGKDVGIILKTENPTYGITVHTDYSGSADVGNVGLLLSGAAAPTTIGMLELPNFDSGTGIISNVTGLDLGIGSNDEDVVFMGTNSPLKAEIRKETTVSITKKKDSAAFDTIFSGDVSGSVGRWGLQSGSSGAGTSGFRDGLSSPDVEFGYRVFVQLKGATEIFSIRNAQITAHTVTLNADGTQEETVELTSQVNPLIFAATGSTGLDEPTTTTEL
tara:strand:+ start:4123 stop:4782 length:660 start_codon:yes stop_codon:yes gene_type:complete